MNKSPQQTHIEQYINNQAGGTVNINKVVSDFQTAPKFESKTEGAQVKLTETQKKAVQGVCRDRGEGVSTFIGNAIETHLKCISAADGLGISVGVYVDQAISTTMHKISPFKDKLTKYEQAVLNLLTSLP